MQTTPIERFRHAASLAREHAHELEVALVAARTPEGTWSVIGGQVTVWGHARNSSPDLYIRTDDAVLIHAAQPVADFDAFLESLIAPPLAFPGWGIEEPLAFPARQGGSDFHDNLCVPLDRPDRENLPSWPLHRLSMWGETRYDDCTRVAQSLPSAPTPYANLRDVRRDLRLATNLADSDRSATLDVIVAVSLRIASVAMNESGVHVAIEWRSLPGSAVRVSFVPVNGARDERKCHELPHGPAQPAGDLATTTVSFARPRTSGPAHVMLSLDGWVCDRRVVGLPDGRAAAHEVFDPESRWLREFLCPEQSRAEQLEVGVTWLLHNLGFAAQQTGAKVLHGAPDVIAFDGRERVVVCECTWTAPEPRKVTDVRHRAELVERRLGEIGIKADVVPVVVTAAAMSEDSVAGLDARAKGVAVLQAADLAHWAERARHGDGPSHFWEHVRGLAQPRFLSGGASRRGGLFS